MMFDPPEKKEEDVDPFDNQLVPEDFDEEDETIEEYLGRTYRNKGLDILDEL